jgi:hypothetical protein
MNSTLKNILLGAGAVAAIGAAAYVDVKHNEVIDNAIAGLRNKREYDIVVRFAQKARQAEGAKRALYAQEALEELDTISGYNEHASTLKAVLTRWAKEEDDLKEAVNQLTYVSTSGSEAVAALQCSNCLWDRRLAESILDDQAYSVRSYAKQCKDKENAKIALAAYNRGEFRS